MSYRVKCIITADFNVENEGLIYLAALGQLASEADTEIPDLMVERALSSPESALAQLVLRAAAFRNVIGVRRTGIPSVEIHRVESNSQTEAVPDDVANGPEQESVS